MKILLATLLLLALPSTAGAAAMVYPVGDVGQGVTLTTSDSWTLLSSRPINMSLPGDIANGVVRRPDGGLQWGSSGCPSVDFPWGPHGPADACHVVPGIDAVWQAKQFHLYRTSEAHVIATLERFYVTDTDEVIAGRGADAVVVRPEFDTPDCNPTGDNARWFVPSSSGPAGLGTTAGAPDDFVAACWIPRAGGSTNPPTISAPVSSSPVKAAACAPITVGHRSVTVTSTGVACGSARNVLAGYMRSSREPRGWVCSRLAIGKARVASCGTPSRSAKKIVGRWHL